MISLALLCMIIVLYNSFCSVGLQMSRGYEEVTLFFWSTFLNRFRVRYFWVDDRYRPFSREQGFTEFKAQDYFLQKFKRKAKLPNLQRMYVLPTTLRLSLFWDIFHLPWCQLCCPLSPCSLNHWLSSDINIHNTHVILYTSLIFFNFKPPP